MAAARRATAVAKPQGRTRVGNGKQLFIDQVDQRSVIARRFKEVLAQVICDIGGSPSEAEMQIARRGAALAVWCESVEAKLAAGEELNIAEFTTASNALRRLFETLGIERRATDITPDLKTYLRLKRGEAAE